MAGKGPPPAPLALLKARGSRRAKRRQIAGELEAPVAAPEMPDWLPADAATEWQKLTPKLLKLGVLAEIDANLLAVFCLTVALVADLTKQIEEESVAKKIAALQNRRQTTIGEVNKLAQQFGLSPSARTRVKGKKPDVEDPLEEFLAKNA